MDTIQLKLKEYCNPFLISDPTDYTSFGVNTLSINNISPQARFSTYIIILYIGFSSSTSVHYTESKLNTERS